MVKTGGKSSRRSDRKRSRAKPHLEQGQIEKALPARYDLE